MHEHLYKLIVHSLYYKQGLFYNFLKLGLYDPRMLRIISNYSESGSAFTLVRTLRDLYLLDKYMDKNYNLPIPESPKYGGAIIFAHNNRLYVSLYDKLYILDIEHIEDIRQIEEKSNNIAFWHDLHLRNDTSNLYVASHRRQYLLGEPYVIIQIRDINTGKIIKEAPPIPNVTSLCYSFNGNRLASIDIEGTLYIWNTRTVDITLLNKYPGKGLGHSSNYRIACFAPDNKHLCLANKDGQVVVINLKTRSVDCIYTDRNYVRCIRYSPNYKYLAIGYNSEVKIWLIGPVEKKWAFGDHKAQNGTVQVSSGHTYQHIYSFYCNVPEHICFSSNSKYLFVATFSEVFVHKLKPQIRTRLCLYD